MSDRSGLYAVIPALNEAGSITPVIERLLDAGLGGVLVGDNGSTDDTPAIARAAGAQVAHAPERGYGRACLAAMALLPDDATAVVYCDADGADDLDRLSDVVDPVLADEADVIIGSRTLGGAEPGALSLPQRVGNRVATTCMRVLYRVQVTDLGPFRCISMPALRRIDMHDPTFGWTTELQVKAYRLGLRIHEVPVRAKVRTAGESKISGKLLPGIQAGYIILKTVWRYHRAELTPATDADPQRVCP